MAARQLEETSEEFSARLYGIIDGGFKSLSIALGVKSGLFEALAKKQNTPMTSQELATEASAKERCVREWLAVMASSRIVELDPDTERYQLPANRAGYFTPGTQESMLADYAEWVPALSDVFNPMLAVLKENGPRGISGSEAESFTLYENRFTSAYYERYLLQELVHSLPGMESKFESGIRMLDVGCGYGVATRILAERFPKSNFVGLDLCEKNVRKGRESAEKRSLSNVEYICADGCAMPAEWTASFDYVFCCNVLHDIPRPELLLGEMKRAMQRGGKMSLVELDVHSRIGDNVDSPYSALRYTISLFHCLPLSYATPGSDGLGMMWGEERIKELLEGNGLVIKSLTKLSVIGEAHYYCELA